MLSSMKGMGTVYSLTGRDDEALKYMEEVLRISTEIGAKREVRDAYNDISNLYMKMGNYEGSFEIQIALCANERHAFQ